MAFLLLIGAAFAQQQQASTSAEGKLGAIATGSTDAANAGLEILKADGNAVDAAVATLLVQTVVESQLYCFGGEVPIIVYDAKRDVVEVIAGLGAAPQLATVEWFNTHRKGVIQGRGDIANAVVPGTLDACITALDRYGSKTFRECSEGMLRVLERRANYDIEELQSRMSRRRGFDAKQFVEHHQNFLRMITRLRDAEQAAGSDRRQGLQAVSDYFYRGPIAREVDAWSKKNGGLLRYSDFAKHHTPIDQPVITEFRGHNIYKCPEWTQGPFLQQTLRLLENRELEPLGHQSADYIHSVVEAMKLAFADRDAFYGDPNFVEVPLEALLSDEYTSMRAKLIDLQTASQEQLPGDPYAMKPLLGTAPRDHESFSGHSDDTSNCLVADKWGNVVAATPSGWGGVPAGDTGLQLGSRMIGLTTWEGHPSVLEPGKRPRITLTPTLIMKNGQPVFAISVAGGDQQDQASIQIALNRIVFGFSADESVKTPRFSTEQHINWFGHLPVKPGTLSIPRDLGKDIEEALAARGHKVSRSRTAGASVVLAIDPETGVKT
ncbi:MAG TPA: hypothetical protein DDW52_25475, partial [Planctomycetaceae bacterium]|nr:hypothetical protein [Planctomycetaceae bacterium]